MGKILPWVQKLGAKIGREDWAQRLGAKIGRENRAPTRAILYPVAKTQAISLDLSFYLIWCSHGNFKPTPFPDIPNRARDLL